MRMGEWLKVEDQSEKPVIFWWMTSVLLRKDLRCQAAVLQSLRECTSHQSQVHRAGQHTACKTACCMPRLWSQGGYLGVTTGPFWVATCESFHPGQCQNFRENVYRKICSSIIAPGNYVPPLKNVTVHVHILCFSIPWVPHSRCEAFFPWLFGN